MTNFGELLKALIKEQKLSLRELSTLSGVPVTTIHHYVRGTEPRISKADKLLNALGHGMVLGKKGWTGGIGMIEYTGYIHVDTMKDPVTFEFEVADNATPDEIEIAACEAKNESGLIDWWYKPKED